MSRASAICRELQALDGDPFIYVVIDDKTYHVCAAVEADLKDLHGDPAARLFLSRLATQYVVHDPKKDSPNEGS
jgi:hypothetical protein